MILSFFGCLSPRKIEHRETGTYKTERIEVVRLKEAVLTVPIWGSITGASTARKPLLALPPTLLPSNTEFSSNWWPDICYWKAAAATSRNSLVFWDQRPSYWVGSYILTNSPMIHLCVVGLLTQLWVILIAFWKGMKDYCLFSQLNQEGWNRDWKST